MIIDLILDRKDGDIYSPKEFYNELMDYSEIWASLTNPITSAMDYGTEEDVKRELCNYVLNCGYNPQICEYINSVEWLN